MAAEDGTLRIGVDTGKAQKDINALTRAAASFDKALDEAVRKINEINKVTSKIQSPFDIAAAQRANTLLAQQVDLARERLRIRQAEIRLVERAGRAQKSLPGTAAGSQLRLPARTSGLPAQVRQDQQQAALQERATRDLAQAQKRRAAAENKLAAAAEGQVSDIVRTRTEQNRGLLALPAKTGGVPVQQRQQQLEAVRAEEGARQARVDAEQQATRAAQRRAEALEKLARAAEGEVSQVVRSTGPQNQKLLPGTTGGPGGQGIGGSRSLQGRLQREVDRQVGLYGKVNAELQQTVNSYNRQQISSDRLVKTQDRLSTQLVKETKTKSTASKGTQGNRRVGNVLAGVGFSALFGGGPGEILGGGIGGLGGLGGSLIGSVIGRFIDDLTVQAAELGQALKPLTADIKKITEAAGIAGTSTEKYILALEKEIGTRAALELASKQLESIVGREGVKALEDFGEASDKLGKALQTITTQLLAELAKLAQGPVVEFAETLDFVSSLRAAQSSSDPRIQGLLKEANNTQSITKSVALQREIVKLQRENTRQQQIQNELTAARRIRRSEILDTAEREYALTALSNKTYSETTFQLERQGAAVRLIADRTKLRRDAEKDVVAAINLQANLRARQIQYEKELIELARKEREAQIKASQERLKITLETLAIEEKIADAQIRAAQRQTQAAEGRFSAASGLRVAELAYEKQDTELNVFGRDPSYAIVKRIEKLRELNKIEREILDNQQAAEITRAKSVEELDLIAEKYAQLNINLKERYALEYGTLLLQQQQLTVATRRAELDQQRARLLEREAIQRQTEDINTSLSSTGTFDLEERTLALKQQRRLQDAIKKGADELLAIELEMAELAPTASDAQVQALQEKYRSQEQYNRSLLVQLDRLSQAEKAQLRFNQTLQKYGFIVDEVSRGLSDAIVGAIKGTETVEQAFARMFENIGKAFIDMATKMLAQQAFLSILGAFAGGGVPRGTPGATSPQGLPYFGPAFAAGGRPDVGRMSLVGENGPELFVPDQRGTIVGANAFDAAKQAMTTSSAVQSSTAALDMEQQQIEALQNPSPIDIRYDSTVINNTTYVTEEQMLESNRRAVKEARARVFSDMRNKPGTRTQLGMA